MLGLTGKGARIGTIRCFGTKGELAVNGIDFFYFIYFFSILTSVSVLRKSGHDVLTKKTGWGNKFRVSVRWSYLGFAIPPAALHGYRDFRSRNGRKDVRLADRN